MILFIKSHYLQSINMDKIELIISKVREMSFLPLHSNDMKFGPYTQQQWLEHPFIQETMLDTKLDILGLDKRDNWTYTDFMTIVIFDKDVVGRLVGAVTVKVYFKGMYDNKFSFILSTYLLNHHPDQTYVIKSNNLPSLVYYYYTSYSEQNDYDISLNVSEMNYYSESRITVLLGRKSRDSPLFLTINDEVYTENNTELPCEQYNFVLDKKYNTVSQFFKHFPFLDPTRTFWEKIYSGVHNLITNSGGYEPDILLIDDFVVRYDVGKLELYCYGDLIGIMTWDPTYVFNITNTSNNIYTVTVFSDHGKESERYSVESVLEPIMTYKNNVLDRRYDNYPAPLTNTVGTYSERDIITGFAVQQWSRTLGPRESIY
jgi:hypothetical protein